MKLLAMLLMNCSATIFYRLQKKEEIDSVCTRCRNGGYCTSSDAVSCTCRPGYSGQYCEIPQNPKFTPENPCANRPCHNMGICKIDPMKSMNYSCDCPLGFTGLNCHVSETLGLTVGFDGDGYLELRSSLLNYESLDSSPALFALAFVAKDDGVLLYQSDAGTALYNLSDFILLRVDNGVVVLEWNLGSGTSRVSIDNIRVTDGSRHIVIVKLFSDGHAELKVDREVKSEMSIGISTIMNADSNIYIGGIPPHLNYVNNYPGLTGCIHQIEFMDQNRALHLGNNAVDGRNTQRCNTQ